MNWFFYRLIFGRSNIERQMRFYITQHNGIFHKYSINLVEKQCVHFSIARTNRTLYRLRRTTTLTYVYNAMQI